MASGNFTLAAFYERRVRRLLPALYAMVALTTLPAFVYLLASERAEFFRSIAAVVTFTLNIFFWSQSGYFDHAAVEAATAHMVARGRRAILSGVPAAAVGPVMSEQEPRRPRLAQASTRSGEYR
jgi:peptidoglycan/LPS O-acetylase OafA/YrhL